MTITTLGHTAYVRLDFARRAQAHFADHPDDHTFCDAGNGATPIGGETVALQIRARDDRRPAIVVFEIPHDATVFEDLDLDASRPDLPELPVPSTSHDEPQVHPSFIKAFTTMTCQVDEKIVMSMTSGWMRPMIVDEIRLPSEEDWLAWKILEVSTKVSTGRITVPFYTLRFVKGSIPGSRKILLSGYASASRIVLSPGQPLFIKVQHMRMIDESIEMSICFRPEPYGSPLPLPSHPPKW